MTILTADEIWAVRRLHGWPLAMMTIDFTRQREFLVSAAGGSYWRTYQLTTSAKGIAGEVRDTEAEPWRPVSITWKRIAAWLDAVVTDSIRADARAARRVWGRYCDIQGWLWRSGNDGRTSYWDTHVYGPLHIEAWLALEADGLQRDFYRRCEAITDRIIAVAGEPRDLFDLLQVGAA